MGNLIKVLTRDIDNNAGNFFLDFENAKPTEAEKRVWEKVSEVLTEAVSVLQDLQSYSGAGETIRQAIQHPNDERVQESAWAAVVPLVGKLKKFYEFSLKLEDALQGLLEFLTSSRCSPTQHLEQEQALAQQFAEILHFTLRFDELKVTWQPQMKGCIKVLRYQPPNSVEGLLNALRYTTKHLNDETTSKQIKNMLQA
ncbi:protein FAM49B-like [Sinocyclocheilus grahami]|uniref:protein FAM49B-like n=1 Tax=Sinocyclocheilus grahami TaxID=75366 RepID=UPI0007AC80F0|nr:PREDICTED: protein FAM49B-like [Sinocyclocheilus grahami]